MVLGNLANRNIAGRNLPSENFSLWKFPIKNFSLWKSSQQKFLIVEISPAVISHCGNHPQDFIFYYYCIERPFTLPLWVRLAPYVSTPGG